MKHVFKISGNRHVLNETTILMVFAILKLNVKEVKASTKLIAIKALRSVVGYGLYEAKHIVEYIAENGRITEHGEVFLAVPHVPVVTYVAED
jgi:ribosomal protein L7/L12